MKRIILLASLSLIIFSCSKEKDFTCQCTYTYSSGTKNEVTHETFPMKSASTDQASKDCKKRNDRYASFGTVGDCVIIP